MEDGLQRILKGENYALTYADAGSLEDLKLPGKVIGIRLIPKDGRYPMAE